MASSTSQPSLLSLPAELRLHIYEYLFVPIVPSTTYLLPRASFEELSCETNILHTCRKCYCEARDLAFSRHTFVVTRNLEKRPLDPSPWPYPFTLITSILLPLHIPRDFHFLGGDGLKAPTKAVPPYTASYTYPYSLREICSLLLCLPRLRAIITLTCDSYSYRALSWLLEHLSKPEVGFDVINHLMQETEMLWALNQKESLTWAIKFKTPAVNDLRVVKWFIC